MVSRAKIEWLNFVKTPHHVFVIFTHLGLKNSEVSN